MNIVIAGAGKVGEALCIDLAREEHNVTLIEISETRLEQLINMADITGIAGNGALFDVQVEAGVEDCQIFIAVTPSDETNIIAALTARSLGAEHTIARVRSPEYSLQMNFLRESLGISLMINPELEAARFMGRLLQFPSALHVEHFEHGRVNIVEYLLPEGAPMVGLALRQIERRFGDVLVAAVVRDGVAIIPHGATVLQAGDSLFLTGNSEQIGIFCRAGDRREKKFSRVLIVGGGRLTRYLLERLQKQRYQVKVIEVDPELADALAADFPQAEVVCGDGTSQAFLQEEHMDEYHVVIALTGIDEENMVVTISAARRGVPKTITKVNRTDLLKVLDNVGLQAIITPNRIIADHIIRFVRSLANTAGSDVEAFYRLADDQVIAMQFRASESSRVCHVPLAQLALRSGLLLLSINRDGELIFPGGSDRVLPGDDVIVVSTDLSLGDLDDILQ